MMKSQIRAIRSKRRNTAVFAVLALMVFGIVSAAYAGNAVYTTIKDGTAVNFNIYANNTDVYISGGPQNTNAAGLPDGLYYFQVTDPSGKVLLSTDPIACRRVTVAGGVVTGSVGGCHANGTFNPANGTTPVQLMPFSKTPNAGGEYKVWLSTNSSFPNSKSKTDNFKVLGATVVPTGSCQPSSSLSVLVTGTNVVSYVPKGSWSSGATGVSVVSVEGSNTLPSPNPIPTGVAVNSCASNPVTGETVCTANDNHVYVISGPIATPTVTPLTSGGGPGAIIFSGGFPINSGVAMDATHNKAVIGLSIGGTLGNNNGTPGFQFLNLATNTFEPAFASQSPGPRISEDSLIDPNRNLLLSPAENNVYEIVNVATSTSPLFFENGPITGASGYGLDSSGEDCSTGIVLASDEGPNNPSAVFIANLMGSGTTFTAGSPGTWTAPSQLQLLTESDLQFGASGLAVAQGTHIGIVSGEFDGNAITAIQLPTAPDTGATPPAISDYVTCSIAGFSMGLDPHTLTAYQSPNGTGDAIALLVNDGATQLAVVDLTMMLNTTTVPRTVAGHGCASGTLPATVVSFLPVP